MLQPLRERPSASDRRSHCSLSLPSFPLVRVRSRPLDFTRPVFLLPGRPLLPLTSECRVFE